jgi:hypothetical protein
MAVTVPFRGSGCGRWLGRVDAGLHFFLWRGRGLLGYLRLAFAFSTSIPSVCETHDLRVTVVTGTCLFVARDREIRRFIFCN